MRRWISVSGEFTRQAHNLILCRRTSRGCSVARPSGLTSYSCRSTVMGAYSLYAERDVSGNDIYVEIVRGAWVGITFFGAVPLSRDTETV